MRVIVVRVTRSSDSVVLTRPWMLCLSLYRSSIVLPLRRVFRYTIMSQVHDLAAPARSDPPSSSGGLTPLSSEPNPNSKSGGVCVYRVYKGKGLVSPLSS